MSRRLALLTALMGCSALGSCTTEPGGTSTAHTAARGQCFLASEVNSWNATKNGNVDIRAGASRYFRLDLGGGCGPNIDWSSRVGIRATAGGNFICEGYDAELIVPDPSGPLRCPVSGVHAISKEQFQSDRKY